MKTGVGAGLTGPFRAKFLIALDHGIVAGLIRATPEF